MPRMDETWGSVPSITEFCLQRQNDLDHQSLLYLASTLVSTNDAYDILCQLMLLMMSFSTSFLMIMGFMRGLKEAMMPSRRRAG